MIKHRMQLDEGLIYTDATDCIGCNNCIRECPEHSANVTVMEDNGRFKIHLDAVSCILCGTCLDTCTHGVRRFHDDTDKLFDDLKRGKKITLMVAPAFVFNYPDEYKHIYGYLKSKGINMIYNVAAGADLTVWAYLNYITKNNATGMLSQPCPVIVSYIERHQTELLNSLIPIQSPMMCLAILLKNYRGLTDDLAFLSPCIAKKIEIESPRGKGLIGYNVTFKSLMKRIKEEGVSIRSYPQIDDEDVLEYRMGAMFPTPGGLRENVDFYLGTEAMVMQSEGEHHVYEYLRGSLPANKRAHPVPTLVDVLNCARGCNYGPGTEFRHTNNDYMQVESHAMRKKKKEAFKAEDGFMILSPAKRLEILNLHFQEFDLNDFICSYENRKIPKHEVTAAELDDMYKQMYKFTDLDKVIDCRACGYRTCREMVEAVSLGLTHKENCMYFVKAELQDQMGYQQQVLDSFNEVTNLISRLSVDNLQIAEDTTTIDGHVDGAVTGSSELHHQLQEVQSEIGKLKLLNEEVSNIARSTNMLSINASIEAAHAGQHGRGFAIVANEVGDLAKKSMAAAVRNSDNSDNIFIVIERLVDSTNSLIQRIDVIKKSTGVITNSVGNITAKSEEILSLLEELRQKQK